jgi:hypothetical protein
MENSEGETRGKCLDPRQTIIPIFAETLQDKPLGATLRKRRLLLGGSKRVKLGRTLVRGEFGEPIGDD